MEVYTNFGILLQIFTYLIPVNKEFSSIDTEFLTASSKKHPEFITRYRHTKTHRGYKKAIIAICRMLLTAIWHILTDLKPYTPEGLFERYPVSKSKVLTASQALHLLKQSECIIKDDAVPIT